MNIAETLAHGRASLRKSDSALYDSKVLLCHLLNCDQTYLLTSPEKQLTSDQQAAFDNLLQQRNVGKPIAHIIGQRGFWSLYLKVTKDTLIPRPDTELLVNLAIEKITPTMKVVDIGTGTGAIALAIAVEKPAATIIACDYSWQAVLVAKENAHRYQINNVQIIRADWLQACAKHSIDMIVSNPPYIKQNDPHLLQGDVQFEPISALVSGEDGLDDIRRIVSQAKHCLKQDGWLMIEHGYHQTQQVCDLFLQDNFQHVESYKDFGGNDRVVIGQLAL